MLDGWRGVAILLVLADHYRALLLHWFPGFPLDGIGQHGVNIFFVLSGYLITSKLLENDASLWQFYVRRFFRLMPVAWTYLLFLAVMSAWLHMHFLTHLKASLFFYRNFIEGDPGNTGHFWSLSIEEQFYFVWPWVLLLCKRKRAFWVAVAGAAGVAIYRFAMWSRYNHVGPNFMTQVRADALLVGCALAILMADPRWYQVASRWSRILILPSLAVLLYCIRRYTWLPPLAESLATAALIAASVQWPRSMFSRVLSFRPLAALGLISYSVYVWQEFFIITGGPWSLFVLMPVFATLSYFCIERPGLSLGKKLTARRRAPVLNPQPA